MKKNLKQILAIVVAISMLAPCVFAAPVAVTASDTSEEIVTPENSTNLMGEEGIISPLELLDDPEEDENIAGTLYGYTETDEKTVKLLRFSETSESGQYLFERHAFRIKEGQKAIFFALAECDKASGEIIGYADGMTLGATISLASGDLLGKDYKVYKFTDSSSSVVTVTDSDPLSFTFLTEGLGAFFVVYDPRLFAVNFYDEGILYHTANISLEDTISIPEVPAREGYTFEGWYTDAGGNGTKLEDGMTYMDILSENVYAYWKVKEPDIYEISDVDDFNSYASLIVSDNATYGKAIYILKNDIDVEGYSLTPFGTQEAPFSGTFDGNGKVISNVTFNDVKHVGIIGYMDGGTVKNLAVTYEDTAVKTYTNCVRFGGIVGVIDTAKKSDVVIENCKTSGNVKIATEGFMRYGGIFSDLRADAGVVKITDCVTFCNADIEAGKTAYIGGFGGYAYSITNTRVYDYTIENCLSYGNVSLTSSAISAYAAGFVGHSFRDDPDIVGGFDGGGIFSTASLFADESNYTNCVSFGNSSVVSAKTAFYGPFAGSKNQFVNFNNCYVSSSQTSTGTSLCQVDVTSKSPEEMNKAEFLSDTLMFDTENVWCINGRGKADLAMFADMSLVIELGDKNADINTRHIEINGIQTEIETDTFTVPEGEENLLVEYTEKDEAGDVVKTEYYFVDRADYKVKKLPMDSYMNSSEKTSIRTKGYTGIRFKARIETGVKFEETEYVIDEYGFVVSRKDILGENELTLDTEIKVTGVGYNKAQNIDVVFEQNDEYHTFTGVVKNIPVKHYKTDLVCKTYTKITVNGEQFVVYGDPVVGNVYDTAKKLLETDPGNEDLIKIVLDYEGELGLPGDGLYPEEPKEETDPEIEAEFTKMMNDASLISEHLIIPTNTREVKTVFDDEIEKNITYIYAYTDGSTKYIPLYPEAGTPNLLKNNVISDEYNEKLCVYIRDENGYYYIRSLGFDKDKDGNYIGVEKEDITVLDDEENENIFYVDTQENVTFTKIAGSRYDLGFEKALQSASRTEFIVRYYNAETEKYEYKQYDYNFLALNKNVTAKTVTYIVENYVDSLSREYMRIVYLTLDTPFEDTYKGYRLISNYEIGEDENGKWRIFYEAFDPFTGAKEYDILSVESADKPSDLPEALAEGTLVMLSEGEVDSSKTFEYKKAWKETDDYATAPYAEGYTCIECLYEYISDCSIEANNDVYIDEDTPIVCISGASENDLFKWGTISTVSYDDFVSGEKNILCYNDKALDENGLYTTKYIDYPKFIYKTSGLVKDGVPVCDFVVVLANGNEEAALENACDYHKTIKEHKSYRIISNYDIGPTEDGKWRVYYEVYNPFTGAKVTDVPSLRVEDKASALSDFLEAGTIVSLSDGFIDDTNSEKIIGSIDSAPSWIADVYTDEIYLSEIGEDGNCAFELDQRLGAKKIDGFVDIYGNRYESKNASLAEDLTVSVITNSSVDTMFKWGTIKKSDLDALKKAPKNLLGYNSKSTDRNGNFTTTYNKYVKAYVSVCGLEDDGTPIIDFILVTVNDDEKETVGNNCEDCQHRIDSEYQRIVKGYEYYEDGAVEYELLNPLTGVIETAYASGSEEIFTPGTIVELYKDKVDREVCTINKANLVWIKESKSGSLVVVPVDESLTCKDCIKEYVENYNEDTYTDIHGCKIDIINQASVNTSTPLTVIKHENLKNIFAYGTFGTIELSDIAANSQNLRCYNDKALDVKGNFTTGYSDYIKAYISADYATNSEYVMVVVNGNENAALDEKCEKHDIYTEEGVFVGKGMYAVVATPNYCFNFSSDSLEYQPLGEEADAGDVVLLAMDEDAPVKVIRTNIEDINENYDDTSSDPIIMMEYELTYKYTVENGENEFVSVVTGYMNGSGKGTTSNFTPYFVEVNRSDDYYYGTENPKASGRVDISGETVYFFDAPEDYLNPDYSVLSGITDEEELEKAKYEMRNANNIKLVDVKMLSDGTYCYFIDDTRPVDNAEDLIVNLPRLFAKGRCYLDITDADGDGIYDYIQYMPATYGFMVGDDSFTFSEDMTGNVPVMEENENADAGDVSFVPTIYYNGADVSGKDFEDGDFVLAYLNPKANILEVLSVVDPVTFTIKAIRVLHGRFEDTEGEGYTIAYSYRYVDGFYGGNDEVHEKYQDYPFDRHIFTNADVFPDLLSIENLSRDVTVYYYENNGLRNVLYYDLALVNEEPEEPEEPVVPDEPEIIEEPYNYRIISNYDIGQDDDGKWRFYYEVYDPFTGAKISDIPSVKSSDKAKNLGTALEAGTVVKITNDLMIDDSEEMVLGKISEDNLTWLRVDSDGSVVACPVKSEVTCPVCVHDEVGNFTDEYRDIFGNNTANPLNITDKTMVSIVKNGDLSAMFKWGTISLSSVDDVKNGKKTLKCYNDKALDANNNFVTKYAEYTKAYICNDDEGNTAFILVVVHGDEASLGETCDKDRDLQ